MKTIPTSRCDGKLAAAIKVGENLVNQVIELADQRRKLRGAIQRARNELAHGRPDHAKQTLAKALLLDGD